MKIKPFLERLTNKWPAKAVSVIAACSLYMLNQYASLDQKSLPVSLEVTQDGEMVCTTHIPSSVSVTIKTRTSNMAQVSAEGISASLDLSYYTREGNFDVPVYVDLPPSLKSLDPLQITVYPEKVNVHLEKNISRTVKVIPRGAGQIPRGHTVNLLADPAYVEIFGPRSIIDGIDSVQTESIVVDGRTSTFVEVKKLINLDRLVKVLEFEEVDVTAKIEQLQGTREFKRVPITLRNLGENFEVTGNFFADFSISGAQLRLENYRIPQDIVSANLDFIKKAGTYDAPVTILLPKEFHLEKISVENIKVTVREKPPLIVDESKTENTVVVEEIPIGTENDSAEGKQQ